MSRTITTPRAGATSRPSANTKGSRSLLACGAVAGPLFSAVVVLQMVTRDGVDPSRHPISLLSLGELGWIQIANFVVAGLLFAAAAVGMRRVLHPGRGGTWGPLLIGVLGIALVWGGVFVADPAYGFPPGTPPGRPDQLSWHGMLHAIGPMLGVLAPAVACSVFARRFSGLRRRGWAAYCTATGVMAPLIGVAAFPTGDYRLLFTGVALLTGWASVMAAHLLTRTSRPTGSTSAPTLVATAEEDSGHAVGPATVTARDGSAEEVDAQAPR